MTIIEATRNAISDRQPVHFGFRRQLAHLAMALLAPILFLVAVIGQPFVDPQWMFLDPLAAAERSADCCHAYFGFVSNLGVSLWLATAGAAILAAYILVSVPNKSNVALFAAAAGLLTGWLALDDLLQIHEVILPFFGIPQGLVLATYMLIAGFYFYFARRVVFRHEYPVLLFSGCCLAASIFVDTFIHSSASVRVVVEDSAKFLGIWCWAWFHICLLARELNAALAIGKGGSR